MQFSMAISAKQNTLVHFNLQPRPRTDDTTDAVFFDRRIKMMKLKRSDMFVVTTNATGTAFVLDSPEFELSPRLRNFPLRQH